MCFRRKCHRYADLPAVIRPRQTDEFDTAIVFAFWSFGMRWQFVVQNIAFVEKSLRLGLHLGGVHMRMARGHVRHVVAVPAIPRS